MMVEMFRGGELVHSSSRRLSERGWGLLIDEEEEARHVLMMGREFSPVDLALWGRDLDSASAVSASRVEELVVPDVARFTPLSKDVDTSLGTNLEQLCSLARGPDG